MVTSKVEEREQDHRRQAATGFPLPAFIYRVSVRDTLPGIGRADRAESLQRFHKIYRLRYDAGLFYWGGRCVEG